MNFKEINQRDNIFEPFPSKSHSDETISIQSNKDYINLRNIKKINFSMKR